MLLQAFDTFSVDTFTFIQKRSSITLDRLVFYLSVLLSIRGYKVMRFATPVNIFSNYHIEFGRDHIQALRHNAHLFLKAYVKPKTGENINTEIDILCGCECFRFGRQ